jgi:hypothetical protein
MREKLRRAGAVGLLACVLATAACSSFRHADPGVVGGGSGKSSPTPDPPVVASVDTTFAQRPVFGVTLPNLTEATVSALSSKVGCRPTLVQRFISVASGVSLTTLQGVQGVPVISMEPWHSGQGPKQPDFTLKATINGNWDAQYKAIAQSIMAYHNVVLVRFAHEMNGDWYPWAITNGNTAADFANAWKHVVDLFRAAGATNVLWVWSPNILRGANSSQISQFWPGDSYVDIVGLTGYGVHEASPDITYSATLKLVQALTAKPVMLSEVGVQADSSKHAWLTAFGGWLKAHPNVYGFVWFQNSSGDDWRFDDTAANLASFKSSLRTAGVTC